MAWDQIDDERWNYLPAEPTPDRHLLRYGVETGRFAEMHRDNVHLYQQPENTPVDPVWPLTEATHIRTDRLETEPATDEQAWEILAQAVAADPA